MTPSPTSAGNSEPGRALAPPGRQRRDRPRAAAGGEVAALAQHGIRAGDRGAADVEGGGELALARQPGAGGDPAVGDGQAQGVGEGAVGRPAGARVPTSRAVRAAETVGVDMVATLSGLAIEVKATFGAGWSA